MMPIIFLLSLLNVSLSFAMEPDERPEDRSQQKIVATITFPKAYFRTDIIDAIKNIISHEKEQIIGAVYRFTRYDIAQQIVDKKVKSGFIVDQDFDKDFCAALRLLCKNNVPLCKWNKGKYNNMHNKFLVFRNNIDNKQIVITGSFNFTAQAAERNAENIVILDSAEIAQQFTQEFSSLLADQKLITLADCEYAGSNAKTSYNRRLNHIPDDERD